MMEPSSSRPIHPELTTIQQPLKDIVILMVDLYPKDRRKSSDYRLFLAR